MTKIGIAIVELRGHFLVGRRSEGKPLAGYDEFPGGKQISPESTCETAVRECLEETGLRVVAREMLHQQSFVYDHGELQLDFWLCSVEAVRLEVLPELLSPWRWVQREELSQLLFPPANSRVLSMLRGQWQTLRSEY